VVGEGESIGKAFLRFKKELQRAGVTWEIRRRKYPRDATQERRAKRFQKRFKARKAMLLDQLAGKKSVASMDKARARFWKRTGKP
jgi:ribosomal protein S21